MSSSFKIGDKVSWKLHTDKGGIKNLYEIIGSKETPYESKTATPTGSPIKPTGGNDFILRLLAEDGKFHAFQEARAEDLNRVN